MPEMTGAQILVAQLRAEGVDTVFGLPGVQIMPAIDALHEQRDHIRLVHARHEQATTYMADGYARVTGRVGVAMVVPGPGALNAAAGLGTAYASSSPVLMISGQVPSTSLGRRRGELHEIDEQLDVFRPITKWNDRVTRVEAIPECVHEAFRQLRTGRPRPVEIEVPPDTLAACATAEIIEAKDYPVKTVEPADIERAVEVLAGAERPAIIAGGGTISGAASAELAELAELLQAPVVTSQQGKGAMPHDHPLLVGVDYYYSPVAELVADADAVLAVGTRLQITRPEVETLPNLIHIDADPDEIGKHFAVEVGIEADARQALGMLVRGVRALGLSRESRAAVIRERRAAFEGTVRDLVPEQCDMVDAMRSALDDDAIVVSGVTNLGYWSNVAFPVRQPRTYITSSYFGTLGYAFPTALGAKVACPGRQVVALCGDGGFMFACQELSTARAHGINVVAVVFNNDAYGASRWDQAHRYGGRFIATELENPDFMKLADAFGVVGLRTSPEGLGAALSEALSADAPVVLEVRVPVMMPPFQVV